MESNRITMPTTTLVAGQNKGLCVGYPGLCQRFQIQAFCTIKALLPTLQQRMSPEVEGRWDLFQTDKQHPPFVHLPIVHAYEVVFFVMKGRFLKSRENQGPKSLDLSV